MPGKARRAVKLLQQNEALDEKEKRVAKQLLESAVTDPGARRLAQDVLDRNGDRSAASALTKRDERILQNMLASADTDPKTRRLAERALETGVKPKFAVKAREAPAKSSDKDKHQAYSELYETAASARSAEEWLEKLEANHNAPELMDLLKTVFGMEGRTAVSQLFAEATASVGVQDYRHSFLATIELLKGLNPQDASQAMLATQMVALHNLSMRTMARASAFHDSNPEFLDIVTTRAGKLMRLFASHAELLARLQGTITSQRIVVEKVDVRDGGQAVVGVIESSRGGGRG